VCDPPARRTAAGKGHVANGAHGETGTPPAAGQWPKQASSTLANPAEHHWHSELPEKDSELAGHVSHGAVPTTLLNVPATHAAHATPSEAAV